MYNNINDVLMFNEPCPTSPKNKNITENNAEEGWDRKSAKQRKLNSYLTPNPHLSHIDLNNSRKIKSLPISKNGSRVSEIVSCNTLDMSRVVLSNTCAVDTIASILCQSLKWEGNKDQMLYLDLKYLAYPSLCLYFCFDV